MRRLVIGDIHGNYRGMLDVLKKAKYSPEKDILIGIGDYVDGYPDSKKVIEFLCATPNFMGVIGNHDVWCKNWLIDIKRKPGIWFSQGGEATLKSYGYTPIEEHKDFLRSLPKYLEIDNMLFVHGGYNPISSNNIKEQAEDPHIFNIEDDLTWDRNLFTRMFSPYYNQESFPQVYKQYVDAITYDKVFIGHTTTESINKELKPLFSEKVIAIDTGGGWSGKITVMDIDTLKYWQSELSKSYYPKSGR